MKLGVIVLKLLDLKIYRTIEATGIVMQQLSPNSKRIPTLRILNVRRISPRQRNLLNIEHIERAS